MGEAAKARCESHARQNEAETDSNIRQQVGKQAGAQLQCAAALVFLGKLQAPCMVGSSDGAVQPAPFVALGKWMRQC